MSVEKKVANALSRELADVIKSVKETGKKQLPLLAQDVITEYKIMTYSNLLGAVLLNLLGAAIVVAGFVGFNNIQNSDGHYAALAAGIVIGGIVILCGVESAISEVTDLVKLKHAPRAVLISRLKRLID